MKVQLIRPPLDSSYSNKQLQNLLSVPAQLCLLAQTIKDKAEVEIRDGMFRDLNQVLEQVEGDLVGVTTLYATQHNTKAILERAKKIGAKTVVGGFSTDFLAERMLRNYSFLDYVVVGDGELALSLLVEGADPSKIPNLVYRDGSEIIRNRREFIRPKIIFDLENLVDRQMFDQNNYFPLAGVKGCVKATKQKRCPFCSIDSKLKVMSAEQYWEQVRILHEKYGVNKIWEVGDLFLVGDWPQRLLATRPKELSEIAFKGYFGANDITEETIELLQNLNFQSVFCGIESTNDAILEKAGKQYRFTDIQRAVGLLAQLSQERGVQAHFPVLYNLEGETRETAQATYGFMEQLATVFPQAEVVASVLVILPGSDYFNRILKNEELLGDYTTRTGGDLRTDCTFNYHVLAEFWSQHIVKTDFSEIERIAQQTRALYAPDRASSFHLSD